MAQQLQMNDQRSLGDLFSELATETGTLIRQEVTLAQAEITHKATKAGKNIAFLAVGGAVSYVGVLAITAAIILLLALVMPAWLSALIVGLVIAAGGYFLIASALNELRKTDPVPRETVQTIKEDARWLKKEVT